MLPSGYPSDESDIGGGSWSRAYDRVWSGRKASWESFGKLETSGQGVHCLSDIVATIMVVATATGIHVPKHVNLEIKH